MERLIPNPETSKRNNLLKLSLGSLGIVFGDLGTSPLYTINECFHVSNGLQVSEANVLGILSLIFWSLAFVVIFKYIFFIMRADNLGEGGMMSLISLIQSEEKTKKAAKVGVLVLLGIVGTCLQLADSVLTPSITVLSAIEGLKVVTPALESFVVPVTIAILIVLFLFQKKGTAGIASIFGPVMVVWFLMIGGFGLVSIVQMPMVLKALSPLYAVDFFVRNQLAGFFLLGAVMLCITGSEALYADMGHFGKKPIQFAWFFLVFPCLVLNYFGQGANILAKGAAALNNPFYALTGGWALYPMIIVATLASIIASQALISGAFSLTQQAMQLGFLPRLSVIHTSSDIHGQIYVPSVNYLLLCCCIVLVGLFQNSTSLASAYGMAVMGTMTITSVLFSAVAVRRWRWKWWQAFSLSGLFLLVDIPYLAANLLKLLHGAWIPLVIGGAIFFIMMSWKRGRDEVGRFMARANFSLDTFLRQMRTTDNPIRRVPGTAVFMTSNTEIVPSVMMHHIKHNKVLHEKVILCTVHTERVPQYTEPDKYTITKLTSGFSIVIVKNGYMEKPDIPAVLRRCKEDGLDITDVNQVSYYVGYLSLLTTGKTKMNIFQKLVFAFLSNNTRNPGVFYSIPANRVIEIGTQIEI